MGGPFIRATMATLSHNDIPRSRSTLCIHPPALGCDQELMALKQFVILLLPPEKAEWVQCHLPALLVEAIQLAVWRYI